MKRGFFFMLIILLFVSSQFTGAISVKQNEIIADVFIYTGPGAWSMGYRAFENFLDSKDLTWFEGDHNYINNNDLVGDFNVIHIPGGDAGAVIDSFNIFGYQHIRDFVSSGGGYIGICGGGYVASDKIIWEGNSYNPPLDLFPGTAFGSIHEIIPYPRYKMTNISINLSNPINTYEPDSESILYYGGAAFYPDEGQEINIIGTYDSFNNDPAIINFNYGDGRVVLFGPHPEIEEDSDRDGETTFHFLEDKGTDWNLLWTCMDWLMDLPISEPPTGSIPPNRPIVRGMIKGNSGIEYNYTVISADPEGDSVYYYIDWGDGTDSGWIGPYDSGILYTTSHVWNRVGHYEIKAKAKDVHGAESDWSDPLIVSMPKNSIIEYKYNIEFLQIFEELFKKIKGKSIIYRVIISYNSEDYIEEIISNIDEELITNYVQTLQDFGPKETGTEACIEAEEYVFNELQNMGLFVQFFPWISEEYDARNIEAVLPGENDECVIISGHLDTVHDSPGADDDCTGIAAVLAAAKTISEYLGDDKLFYTIRFVAFTGKEQGLYGSKDYANNAKESGLEIIAHLGTDMLGHTGNYKYGTEFVNIMRRSTSDWIAEFSKDVAEKYEESIGLTISKKTGGADSDYWAFLLNDYDAVFFHESYFNPYWHTPDDTIDKLDLEYDSRVTRLIVATLLSLADNEFGNQPPSPPSQLSGPSSGKPGVEYNYSCKSFDNEGDQIYFQWDWGDGSFSDWLGPYDHDIRLRTPHTWDNKGDFDVRVKAKDEYGAESDWSNPLSISMPKNRRASFPILNNLLVRYFDNHPFMDGAFVHL